MSEMIKRTRQRAKQSISSRGRHGSKEMDSSTTDGTVGSNSGVEAMAALHRRNHSKGQGTIISRNAYRGGTRPLIRYSRWFYRAIDCPEALTPEIVEAAKHRSIALLSGNAGYWSASITKLITKYEFSETDTADFQELAKVQNDFKNSLMQ